MLDALEASKSKSWFKKAVDVIVDKALLGS